jgi:hypothetical protein
MLDSNMRRENVDGEAPLWAHARMMTQQLFEQPGARRRAAPRPGARR